MTQVSFVIFCSTNLLTSNLTEQEAQSRHFREGGRVEQRRRRRTEGCRWTGVRTERQPGEQQVPRDPAPFGCFVPTPTSLQQFEKKVDPPQIGPPGGGSGPALHTAVAQAAFLQARARRTGEAVHAAQCCCCGCTAWIGHQGPDVPPTSNTCSGRRATGFDHMDTNHSNVVTYDVFCFDLTVVFFDMSRLANSMQKCLRWNPTWSSSCCAMMLVSIQSIQSIPGWGLVLDQYQGEYWYWIDTCVMRAIFLLKFLF